MRKLFILGLCLVLSGCMRIDEVVDTNRKPTENKEPEIIVHDDIEKLLTCTNEDDEKLMFEAKGDELNKLTHTFYMSFKQVGIKKDMDKEAMEKSINESLSNTYGKINGVEVSGKLKKDKVEITMIIDYELASIDDLIEAGLVHEGEKGTEYISFEETVIDYQNNGYACKQE